MIGERKRNHTLTRKPTADSAKEQPICQLSSRRRSREDNWLESICPVEGLEPSRRVEH
jgi:hypothetical protein